MISGNGGQDLYFMLGSFRNGFRLACEIGRKRFLEEKTGGGVVNNCLFQQLVRAEPFLPSCLLDVSHTLSELFKPLAVRTLRG